MLRLAVATKRETFDRIGEPLGDRGIAVEHVPCESRVFDVSEGDSHRFEGFDVGFVYPSRLMEGGAVDALLSVPWVNGLRAVATSRNKAAVYTRLAGEGIPVPETRYVSNPVGESSVVDAAREIGFPLVVKPNSTTRGVGVTRVDDLDSLSGIVDYLDLVHDFDATGDRSYLLQEFLPAARDYRVMVVDGVAVGAVERRLPDAARRAGRWKHNVHRGGEAVGVDLPERGRTLAERTARTLGIEYLGVDLLRTDDRWLVNETNARPTVDDADKYEPGFYDRLAGLIRSLADE
ncbi:Glutathione synthase/glutaminyl transferase/alpha-L-glutamate ligase [Halalkaliarchaeum sp. AArc-CO]|uniref:ATP-grasp domain-containing protein n=1 Tax=unclassified Halalkaliarchaeum TaxID=2678344 RepID=UPI00217D708D|nr:MULTISPECIES: ATP-grasp domain-containing protein [unclassified Halalkaliarchaeum]MDR5673332.1 ATP-grasp domain-containing protein [Halalkaliarchaeum sp. AArc-GB]UWG49673.1 Glutathione synthase/glutaminyl transferase/alpha-L-glutamate ligase [Halalkaliarchaeum sp. AArc-CO]